MFVLTCHAISREGIKVHGNQRLSVRLLPNFVARQRVPDNQRIRGVQGGNVVLSLVIVRHPLEPQDGLVAVLERGHGLDGVGVPDEDGPLQVARREQHAVRVGQRGALAVVLPPDARHGRLVLVEALDVLDGDRVDDDDDEVAAVGQQTVWAPFFQQKSRNLWLKFFLNFFMNMMMVKFPCPATFCQFLKVFSFYIQQCSSLFSGLESMQIAVL